MNIKKISVAWHFLAFLLFFTSCDLIENSGKRSVVYLIVDNTQNCTEAVIEDSRTGEVIMVIPSGRVEQTEITASLFDQQDQALIFAHTPYRVTDRILAGDKKVIPQGCRNWGTDTKRIRIRDGYDTIEYRVQLRPPSHWNAWDFWNDISLEEQIIIGSFWQSRDVELNIEILENTTQ